MKLIRIIALLVIVLSACQTSFSQKVDSAYLHYPTQYKEMAVSRALDPFDIDTLLENYKRNNIRSNEDFAKLLIEFYPTERNTAILLYFYEKNTLRRILFEPGVIKEDKSISITKKELLELGTKLNQSLDLYKLTEGRSPQLRGIKKKPDPKAKANYNEVVENLSSILLPRNFSKDYKHLVVIPCLNIGAFPFHLLRPYNDSLYLIERCSFTIAPTLLDFVFLRGLLILKHPDLVDRGELNFNLEKALFVCNPEYPVHTDYVFPNLPGAEKEIENALQYADDGYTLLKGRSAIKDSVLKYMNGADVAYFATHGVADENDPMKKSFLVLSGKNPFLTSKEIQDLRKDKNYHAPELIILSACQTGLGKAMEAGLAGSLARSFILSGSYFIIESLWSVDDNATAFLMNRFIYHLRQGSIYTPAGALRLAILDTKKVYPNPAHWASFSAFGINF